LVGRPFSDAGFGNNFCDWCDQAGLHHCAAHGVRKAGPTIAAENGATTKQLMANLLLGFDQASGDLHSRRRAEANGH
jgi:hypothetical protein